MITFNELLTLHFKTYKRVYIKAVSFNCGDPVAAEDIIQDAYVKAIENKDSFNGELELKKFNTWFYTITQRAMVDYYRKEDIRRQADLRFFQEELDKELDVEAQAIRELVLEREVISKRKDRYLGVVYDRIILGLPFSVIAQQRGISVDAALQRVGRFKKELGAKYEGLCRGLGS